jgi:hypothetical protein
VAERHRQSIARAKLLLLMHELAMGGVPQSRLHALALVADDHQLPLPPESFLACTCHPAYRWRSANLGKHFLFAAEPAGTPCGSNDHHRQPV